ncbi:unnamed protein product [Ceutorhynchus assimilis]|uniref:Uncharacterized protein n=1 Tax=Ceutorhynchus assimilis TaxID=467358 RepID=A0A9N9MGQ3_9CUCU|nr:unnamed protein product [Ceutorhynchus assimilis]
MVDCVEIMRNNSQDFLFNLKTTDFSIKNMTKGFLLEIGGSILCLETTDVDVTKVLLGQVLINLKKDTIFKDNLREILFTDISSFNTITSEQNEDFLQNFPDLLVCILDHDHEEPNEQSHVLKSWINIIKANGKKVIFIMKNSKHLEKTILDNEMENIFKLKLDKLWKENEIPSNDAVNCEVDNNIVNNESARALDESMNINLKEEESSIKTSLIGETTTENADLTVLFQSLIVTELNAVDKEGNTQLHLAARDGKTEIVESIFVHGVKKDVRNNRGLTALHLAAQMGHSAIVNMLLENGFSVDGTQINQLTPLHYASSNHDDVHLIEILLKFDAEIERKNIFGRTALHLASQNGHSTVVNLLLKNGANVNARDNHGETPMHKSISKNKQEIVSILLQHGALLNIKNYQQENALDTARSCNFPEIIQILVKHDENHSVRC